MRTTLGVLFAIGVVLCPRDAGAAAHSARLVYVRAKDAVVCADEAGVRAAVAKRLGYDPFVGFADMTLIVDVRRADAGFSADLRVVHSDGVAAGTRVLRSESADCAALVDALALTMSIVVDPVSALRKEPPSETVAVAPPPPAPTPEPAPPSPPAHDDGAISETATHASPPEPKASTPLHPVIAFAPFGSIGEGPGLAVGGIVHASIERDAIAIGIEARADLVSQHAVSDGGSLRAHSVSAWVAPCAEWTAFEACALVGVGAVFAESSGVPSPRSDTGIYFGMGARAAIPFRIGAIVIVRPFVDAIVQPFQTRYELRGVTAYRASPFGVDLGLMVGARFR